MACLLGVSLRTCAGSHPESNEKRKGHGYVLSFLVGVEL